MSASKLDPAGTHTEDLAPIYRLLGRIYLEPPTESTVTGLHDWCDSLEGESLPPGFADGVTQVRTSSSDRNVLRGSFTRLLQGVSYGGAVAPPYESLYVDGVLNGPSSTEVDAFYRGAGVELAVDDELIDHAGYELAFLAELCARGDTERQLAFIRTHIGDWIGEFHDAAAEAEPPSFYRGVFGVTEGLLELHAETLEANDG